MRQIIINVTRDDIANGEPQESKACPIALAATRSGLECVQVEVRHLFGILDGYLICAALQPEVQKFIHDFDEDFEVKPIAFMIEPRQISSEEQQKLITNEWAENEQN